MTLRIDAHQHFWHWQPQQYAWITADMARLRQDFLPPQLAVELAAQQIDGSLLVQARQSDQETDWLLALADATAFVKGVVGWLDLQSPAFEARLDRLTDRNGLRGFRHQIQDEASPAQWMALPRVNLAVDSLQRHGYVWELLVRHRQLADAALFAARHDDHYLVLDHMGKPDLAAGAGHWAKQIAPLAAMPHVSCKLSGLLTEPRPAGFCPDDLMPFIDAALEAFGSDRLLAGSDWPVCLLAGDYVQGWQLIGRAIAGLTAGEQAAICGGNACRLYALGGDE